MTNNDENQLKITKPEQVRAGYTTPMTHTERQEFWQTQGFIKVTEDDVAALVVDDDENAAYWDNYLYSIGVTDLNNEEEINDKLDEVERSYEEYEINIIEALQELKQTAPITNIRLWLQSLLD